MKIASCPLGFSSLFMTHQNQADHTFWPHLRKNKQKMKTGWTTHSWNNAIWLALRPCHMTMMHKINKLEKPGRSQGNSHALFGRSPTFYGLFRVDVVTSERSTCISSSRWRNWKNWRRIALFWFSHPYILFIKVACRVQIWKKTFSQNSEKFCCSFIQNDIMLCIYFIFTKIPLF